jgi:hypothetical protein
MKNCPRHNKKSRTLWAAIVSYSVFEIFKIDPEKVTGELHGPDRIKGTMDGRNKAGQQRRLLGRRWHCSFVLGVQSLMNLTQSPSSQL